MIEEDMLPFEKIPKEEKYSVFKDPVMDENDNFTEREEIENRKKIAKLKKGISCAALQLDNYQENVERFYGAQPFFYDKNGLFWFWSIDDDKWIIVDDIDIMNSIDERYNFQGMTVNRNTKSNYMEAFKRVGRKKKPKDAFSKWIQFKNKAYSISAKTEYTVTPEYFFTNPIPYELGKTGKTPVIDSLFEAWVGKKYVKTLYEVIAYCCYTSYPIQLLFCLYGSGRNGKSCFLRLLARFLGMGNICSTELDVLMDSRFEAFKLYKKLACFMGETNFGTMKKTSMIKKLVGGDYISYEKKNKDPFDEINYAKILIASNSLPSSDDTSEGFYRRWLIIDFPNEFPEGKDILLTIPEQEYSNLARKVTQILPKLIELGEFTNQGTLVDRKQKYILASNPLTIFINTCCFVDEDTYISYGEIYTAYVQFLKKLKRRRVKMREFKAALEDEGYWVEKTSKKIFDGEGGWKTKNWIDGLELKADWKEKMYTFCAISNGFSTQISTQGGVSRETGIKGIKSNEKQPVIKEEVIK